MRNCFFFILFFAQQLLNAQTNFNGIISTYSDSTSKGYNSIIETYSVENKDYNGVMSTYATPANGNKENGIIETINNDKIKTIISSIYYAKNIYLPSKSELDRLLKILPKSAKILILGYGDATGNNAINLKISTLRAKYLAAFLKKNGYNCTYKGMGIDYSNTNDMARRCDLIIE